MAQAPRDENFVPTLLAVSSVDGVTPVTVYADPTTHRLLTDSAGGGSGTVTSVSVVSANGFAGTVATATTTPAITLSTTVTGILSGNGTAISAASTTGSGAVVLANSPTFVDDITVGTAATATGAILFKGVTSGTVTLKVADVAGTYTFTLPTDDGNSGEVLSTNGSGVTSWVSAGGVPTTITVASETVDTSCYVGFFTAATGDLGPKTNPNFIFNSATNSLGLGGAPLEILHLIKPTTEFTTIRFDSGTTQGYFFAYDVDNSVNIGSNSSSEVNLKVGGATELKLTSTAASPGTSDGTALGTTALMWSDLFLASGAVINFDNGNSVVTHSSAVLTVSTGDLRVTTAGTNSASVVTVGGTQTLTNKQLTAATVNTSFTPTSNDGSALGSGTLSFADLFLATGAVLNIANGNWVATHTSGILTVTTGDLRVTSANVGTNADSVPTLSSTSTLTNKTLTSPAVTTGTYTGAQQLAENASIRLDQTLSADGTFSGTTIAGTAGATLAFGDLIYLAVADSRWELVDADSVTTAGAVLTGMCVLAAASDGDATVILLQGNIRADANFPALTVGAPVYASTTPGDIQVAQPSGTDDVIQVVGFALTADSIYFNPSQDYITHV